MLVVASDIFFLGMLIWAGASDLFTMTIPNRIVLLLLAGYIVFAPLTDVMMMQGLWAGGLALGAALVLFGYGWIGGGDAKLFAATALWLGVDHLVPFAFATSLFGLVLTIGVLIARALPVAVDWSDRPWVARLLRPGGGVPYGIAIAFAGLAVRAATP